MARIEQPSDGHGSLKDIQILVNEKTDLIDSMLRIKFPDMANDSIIWKSPLKSDNYAEYLDDDFIEKIGLDKKEIKLHDFWPKGGPHWDALATTTSDKIILVEAKANIPEVVTSKSDAGEISKKLIIKSLEETKSYLGIKNDIDWSGKFYQYTNRLAHLYFLRVICKKPAYLINIYFLNDKSVNGPETEREWRAALQVMYSYFGISRHKLNKYMTNIFIDVNELI